MERENQNIGEGVRVTQYGGSMKELVFDEVTGEFVMVPKSEVRSTDHVVTEMTEQGFA